MRHIAVLMLLTSSLSAPAAMAGDKLKPGLWEVKLKSDAMKDIPKISPEQLEQMRSMGIHVPQIQPDGIVTQICLTQEMVEKEQMPMAQNESGCQAKNYQRNANSYSVDIYCSGTGLKGNGVVRGKIVDSENFSSTYEFKGTAHGQPVTQRHDSTGRWLAAKCGNVKPAEAAPGAKK